MHMQLTPVSTMLTIPHRSADPVWPRQDYIRTSSWLRDLVQSCRGQTGSADRCGIVNIVETGVSCMCIWSILCLERHWREFVTKLPVLILNSRISLRETLWCCLVDKTLLYRFTSLKSRESANGAKPALVSSPSLLCELLNDHEYSRNDICIYR